MARLPRASVPSTPSAQCRHPDAWRPLYPISPPLLSHSTRRRDGVQAGGAAGGSAPQGPHCPSAQRCPWPPQPGPWGHILLRVLALQPCSQHVFPEPLVCASHGPCGRKAQTCPLTRPLPTLLPESSEKKRASLVSLQAHRSPAGLSTCVCMCVHHCANAHEHTHADRSPVRCHLVYLAGPRQSSLAGACSPASSVPPPPHLPQ